MLDESRSWWNKSCIRKGITLNPEPSPEVQEELPFDTQEEVNHPAPGTTTAEFEEEVREVESVYDNRYGSVTPDYGNKPVIQIPTSDIIEEELAKKKRE